MSKTPNTNRWLGKRGIQTISPKTETPQELIDAARKLGVLLDGNYYEWSSTLETTVIMNHEKYLLAINEKIEQIEEGKLQ